MLCPRRSRSGTPSRFEPMAAPGATAPTRRYAASAPSRPRAAPAAPQATLHVFRSCDRSLFSPSCRYNRLAWPAPPMTSDIGGMSPGTDDGAMTIRIPKPTIASPSGTSMAAFAGSTFWARMRTASTDIHVTLMTLSAINISISPMLAAEPVLESSADALAAALAEVPLERRELVDTGRDYKHAGGEGTVRPVQLIYGDANECPDRKVRPDEQRHGAHTPCVSAAQDCRSRARQHHRRHHCHPEGDKERERTNLDRNAHVHPVHLPDRNDPGRGGEPERRRQRGCRLGCRGARLRDCDLVAQKHGSFLHSSTNCFRRSSASSHR